MYMTRFEIGLTPHARDITDPHRPRSRKARGAIAGRAHAASGGVYIASSMIWIGLVEGQRPDRWDVAGLALCLIGSAVIFLPSRN